MAQLPVCEVGSVAPPAEECHTLNREAVLPASAGRWGCERMCMRVSQLRFTHDSIRPRFRDGRPLEVLFADLCAGHLSSLDLEPLDVVWALGRWCSFSNRRLYVLQWFAKEFSIMDLEVNVVVFSLSDTRVQKCFKKANTTGNGGRSVQVRRSRSLGHAPKPSCPSRRRSSSETRALSKRRSEVESHVWDCSMKARSAATRA
eukprot:TRINITY_DN50708_c0_g1_i1.p1 TRINITY_DN50708_c0_g1~~TRINITY_DN50708_c0_g1_i1.p1  ORF type:complete len:216 (-),score=13.36 TRINITY_DN50708_c0_g1_i1:195-800(-)